LKRNTLNTSTSIPALKPGVSDRSRKAGLGKQTERAALAYSVQRKGKARKEGMGSKGVIFCFYFSLALVLHYYFSGWKAAKASRGEREVSAQCQIWEQSMVVVS